ncbi:hypothetical protein LTR50_002846 [Elasticomyces elasticus]|nr:hypothetical protein LTR50_002846 [Elasticomyces elasticus]
MPFAFTLPTTSALPLHACFTSPTHPSLPLSASTHRAVLRDALKKHKRLASAAQAPHLPILLAALNEYIPYLLALDAARRGQPVAGETVIVSEATELVVEWRTTLTATLPGREPPRVKLSGLQSEIAFALSTLGYVHTLLARAQLYTLHAAAAAAPATAEQRTAAIGAAMKHLLDSHSIHVLLLSRPPTTTTTTPLDITPPTLTALSELALAEATLIAVQKDDPYPAASASLRDKSSKEWMYRAPSIPKVRAHLFARLCLCAAEHADRALALLSARPSSSSFSFSSSTPSASATPDDALQRYVRDLRRTARGRACRFLGIDAELAGRVGEALAWLKAARTEMGFAGGSGAGGGGERRGIEGLRRGLRERREDGRVERGEEWGMDAGRLEEGRVVEGLEGRWGRVNDAVDKHPTDPPQRAPPGFSALRTRIPRPDALPAAGFG